MKIITAGPASGKLGNTVTAKNRFGHYQRALAIPLNPQTIDQQNQRGILGMCASSWRGLTEDQRLQWAALAAQLSGNLTGFQTYTKVNATLVTGGMDMLEDPPLPPSFDSLTITGCTAVHAGAIKITGAVRNDVNEAPDQYFVEGAPPVSQGINFRGSTYRLIKVVDGADVTTVAADLTITAEYNAKFGAPVATQKIAIRITPVLRGIKGVALACSAIVT